MKMIKRLMHFETLAESTNPVVAEVGRKLLNQAILSAPKAISPVSAR